MAILWKTTKSNKTASYKGYVPMPSTIDEPSFAEKWKRWRTGDPAKFLTYKDLQELVLYCYNKNLSVTITELELVFHDKHIYDKETAIKYINEHMNEFGYIDEYSGRVINPSQGGSNTGTNSSNGNGSCSCCCCCKKP